MRLSVGMQLVLRQSISSKPHKLHTKGQTKLTKLEPLAIALPKVRGR